VLNGGAHLDDLGQRLVADHQVIVPWRWSAVLKGTDLLVGSADADVQHPHGDLVGLGEPGNLLLDDLDLMRSGKYCDCLHDLFPVFWPRLPNCGDGRVSLLAKSADMAPRQLHRSTLDELLRLAYGIRRQASTITSTDTPALRVTSRPSAFSITAAESPDWGDPNRGRPRQTGT
jgi:hypothetical protein